MSSRRTTRSDAFVDGPRVLKAVGECRRVLIEGLTRAKVGGPLYYSMSTVVAAIDGLALMLTGERYHFHTQPAPSTWQPALHREDDKDGAAAVPSADIE